MSTDVSTEKTEQAPATASTPTKAVPLLGLQLIAPAGDACDENGYCGPTA